MVELAIFTVISICAYSVAHVICSMLRYRAEQLRADREEIKLILTTLELHNKRLKEMETKVSEIDLWKSYNQQGV